MPATVETERTCAKCSKTQPIEEYYELRGGRNGRMAHCRTCNNKGRPATQARVINNRARNRAYADLVKAHQDEFDALLAHHRQAALAELEQLRAAAAEQRREDTDLPRLKPGPMRNTDGSILERLDVARCPHCHQHHDRGHQCENCGDVPAELIELDGPDIDYVAIDRRMAGDRSVRLSKAEKIELVARWQRSGRSLNECERITGITRVHRYIARQQDAS